MAKRTPDPGGNTADAGHPAAGRRPVRLLHLADLGFRTDAAWNGTAVLATLIERIRLIADILSDPEQRAPLIKRHDPYRAFLHKWYGKAQPLPWWQQRRVIGGQSLAKGYAIPPALAEGFRQTCLAAIADEIPPLDRLALGLCLGRLRDPRVLSLLNPAAYCEVPAGDYPYGEGEERVRIAEPFRLSRYPVTNSQYREFMEAGGYTNPDYWSDAGRERS